MRKLLSLLLLFSCATVPAPRPSWPEVDRAIETAIAEKKLPGGVFHFEHDGEVYEKAYGNRSLEPVVEAMTVDTIFDAASLTKVTATTPAIWLLIERGKIGIDDPAQKYIPEFPYGDITIRHLLTHTSGLRPDLDLKDPWSGYDTAMKLIMAEKLTNKPGMIFKYSDINFELLGEIVRRVSSQALDVFTKKEIFEPLQMRDTGFRPLTRPSATLSPLARGEGQRGPSPRLRGEGARSADEGRIAPTEYADGKMLRGVVHDPTARRMGGVAGHAGLFTTAADLAKYCRMLLGGGSPIFKPETVKRMTSVQSPANVAIKRTGGFDLDSGYSRPRGALFPIGSYGHTGFTGTTYWIDPASNTFYIFLANSVHPNGKGTVANLRYDLGTLAAKAAGYTAPTHPRVGFASGDAQNGIDVVAAKHYEQLRGLRLGLITNQSGIDKSGNPTIDLLHSAPGITLVSLFSPEHGIRGTADENVSDSIDDASGLPIYSLYGDTRKPKPEQLAAIDALVFDVQDVGVRFYTNVATMKLAMEAAEAAHKKFIVLDRVNPIGSLLEGPILKGAEDFIGWYNVPVSHGMTVGELAKMFRGELYKDLDLTVIEVRNWKRDEFQDEAGLPWINTSPNMRSLTEATLYPGMCLIEHSVSVGRGTATPFEIFGAPYIDGQQVLKALPPIAGVTFTPVKFTPTASNLANKECGGLRITLTDRKALHPVAMGVAIATTLYRLYPKEFPVDAVNRFVRDPATMEAIKAGRTIDWTAEESSFAARRAPYLLYR